MKTRWAVLVAAAVMVNVGMAALGLAQVAQQVGISGSPNPVGSGARALGMGGAFIGVADDATAASWNPGGLIQLEKPELSVVLSYEFRSEKRTFRLNPGASGTFDIELADINYLSGAWPFKLFNRNMVVSLNYQTLYDFNREIATSYTYSQPFPGPSGPRRTTKEISGYLKALSPALAVQITPQWSVGAALNWFPKGMDNQWENNYTDRLVGTFAGFPYSSLSTYHDEYAFEGINFTLGTLWNVNKWLTLGAVYKTQFNADVHYLEWYAVNSTTQQTPRTVVMDEDQTMVMPASYGLGVACRFSDAFSMDLDVYRTDWQHFLVRQASGREVSLFDGRTKALSDTKPTHQVRLGAEYLFIRDKFVVPLRGGVFYDPEPTAYEPDEFYGASLGSGIIWGPLAFDVAYVLRWGNDVRKVRLGAEYVPQDVRQHTVHASVIWYF